MTFSRILVPTDFSDHADAALAIARDLARRYGASVHLLHVVETPLAAGSWAEGMTPAAAPQSPLTPVGDAVARLERRVADDAGNIDTMVRSGLVPDQILEAASDEHADLIVMGTHGRTGLAHVLMGSVAEHVVRRSSCPVLTLRSRGVAASTHVA